MLDPAVLRARVFEALTAARVALARPVDVAWLAFFRIGFGAVMLWEVYRYFSKGWVESKFIGLGFHFKYYGFEWVEPWPGDGMTLHFGVLGVLAACVMVGFLYRIAVTLLGLGFAYVFLLEQAYYLNHFYLVCLLAFVMALLPAHHAWSVDAVRRPELRSGVVPAWSLWALRAQLGIPYFYAGLAKLNGDWLRGEPIRQWLATRVDFLGDWVLDAWVPYFFAWGGTVFDLFVVPALLHPRTRYLFLAAGFFFHLTNAYVFRIGIFPWMSMVGLLVFLPHDLPRRWLSRMPRFGPDFKLRKKEKKLRSETKLDVVAKRVLLAHVVLQVLIPLRHHLYPGDTAWTQEGHRYAWRMKLRSGKGACRFRVVDPWTREVGLVHADDVLDRQQARPMVSRPDMILQFAHYLARRFEEQRGQKPEVYADCRVALNGRPHRPLVNPAIDLAKVERSLLPSSWLLPNDEPLPSHDARVAAALELARETKELRAAQAAASSMMGGEWEYGEGGD